MGKNYASIHVFDMEQEKSLSVLKKYYHENNSMNMNSNQQKALDIFRNTEAYDIVKKLCENVNEILILQSESFISIYDDSVSFEEVEEKALSISKLIDKPILYTTNFDEDIFLFGIYRNKKLVTSRNVGLELSTYDISPKALDFDIFCNELSVNKMNSTECLNSSNDIEEIESEIENIIGVPLHLSYSDVEAENNLLTEEFTDQTIRVFKMRSSE